MTQICPATAQTKKQPITVRRGEFRQEVNVLVFRLRLCLPSCLQTMVCVSVSSFLPRMAPTDPCRRITELHLQAPPHHLTTSPRHLFTSPPPPYLDRLWDLVDVLRLDDGPQVVLQDFGEVVLQLGASEVGQDLLPVWRILGNKDNMIVSAKPVKVCVMSCESRDRLTVDM